MNAPFSLGPVDSNRESFDRLKLQMLQAFYQLDVALEDWLHDGNRKAGGASTGGRLKELMEINFPQTIATKAQVARFARLSDELDTAIKLRNLVVHSEARFGKIDDLNVVLLSPVRHTMRVDGYVAVTDLEKITAAIDRVKSCAKTLGSWRAQRDCKCAPARDDAPLEEDAK